MFSETITALEQKSKSAIPRNPSDYVGDGSKRLYRDGVLSTNIDGTPLTDEGLIYCGTCHKLKQYRIYAAFLGRLIEPFVLCDCEEKIDERERQRIVEYNRQRMIKDNLADADSLMLRNTFRTDSNPKSAASRKCREFVSKWNELYKPQGIGLYIYGDVGVGKTFYASCIANEVARVYGEKIKALSINKIMNDIFSTKNPSEYIGELMKADLLVIDDLGTERKTDYGIEQVFTVIDERYKTQKPLIITGNVDYATLSRWKDIKFRRIYDRIIDMCLPLQIVGESHRHKPSIKPSVYRTDTASFDINKFEDWCAVE